MKKEVFVLMVFLAIIFFGCVKQNTDKEERVLLLNYSLEESGIEDLYKLEIKHNFRLVTSKGYWYFRDVEGDWENEEFNSKATVTYMTNEYLDGDVENAFMYLNKGYFNGFDISYVEFYKEGKKLSYIDGEDRWLVTGVNIKRGENTSFDIYIMNNIYDIKNKKELVLYPFEESDRLDKLKSFYVLEN